MGGSQSTDKLVVDNSNGKTQSYFGESNMNMIDENHPERSIRELQLENLYRTRPDLRPKPPRQSRGKFKAYVSISQPDFILKKWNDNFICLFGLKAELPGKVIVSAGGLINTFTFTNLDQRQICAIPVPHPSDFVVEISSNLEEYTGAQKPGYKNVNKLIYKFQLLDIAGTYSCRKISWQIQTEDETIDTDCQNPIEIESIDATGKCLFCLENPATEGLNTCEHKQICIDCINLKMPRLAQCPDCSAPPK